MSMEFRPGYGGPYVNKTEDASPQNAVWTMVNRLRGLTREKLESRRSKLEKEYVGQSREDPALSDANAKYAFTNAYNNILRKMEIEESSSVEDYEEKKEAKEAAVKEEKEKIKKAIAATKRSFLVDFIMTHTFGELWQVSAASKKVAKISKMGKPKQRVADVLTEADVLKVLNGK